MTFEKSPPPLFYVSVEVIQHVVIVAMVIAHHSKLKCFNCNIIQITLASTLRTWMLWQNIHLTDIYIMAQETFLRLAELSRWHVFFGEGRFTTYIKRSVFVFTQTKYCKVLGAMLIRNVHFHIVRNVLKIIFKRRKECYIIYYIQYKRHIFV